MSNVHEVVYSNQQHMKLYRFVRTVFSVCDFDNSEDSYTRTANAYMANWHSPVDSNARNADACFAIWHSLDDSLPDSFNSNACFSYHLLYTSD